MEKTAAASFKSLWEVSFPHKVKKLVVYFSLCESSLHFLRGEDQINTVYGGKFCFGIYNFPFVDI